MKQKKRLQKAQSSLATRRITSSNNGLGNPLDQLGEAKTPPLSYIRSLQWIVRWLSITSQGSDRSL